MDPQTFMDIANLVTRLKMWPYFDVANFVLMCNMVRDDFPPTSSGSQLFSRKHPFSCWVASMLMCFAGGILGNVLLGEPIVVVFKSHEQVLAATAVWYLVNYCPFDIFYRLSRFLPIKICLWLLKEVQRTRKIYDGVLHAAHLYPNAYGIMIMLGIAKGSGANIMRLFVRLALGVWAPTAHEFMKPSFVTKGATAASIVFICERLNLLQAPHAVIYFGVVIFFVYFRLSSLLLGIHDPFIPFENLFCAVFMGGIFDALKRAMGKDKKLEDANQDANSVKNKEDKKRD